VQVISSHLSLVSLNRHRYVIDINNINPEDADLGVVVIKQHFQKKEAFPVGKAMLTGMYHLGGS
jgi:hypothetical protein